MNLGSTVKQRRLSLGLTLEELSRLTAFSVGYLSKLEHSESIPPLATLQKLALALNMDMMDILNTDICEEKSADNDISVFRGKDLKKEHAESGNYFSYPIIKDHKNRVIAPFIMCVESGETEIFTHDAEEFIFILEGNITLRYKDNDYILEKGDSAYIDSRRPHSFINEEPDKAVILTANYIYRRF